jgi:hypothetical protein
MGDPSSDNSGLTRVYLGGVTLLLALTLTVRATSVLPYGSHLRPLVSHVVVSLISGAGATPVRRDLPAERGRGPIVAPSHVVRIAAESQPEVLPDPVRRLRPESTDLPPPHCA